MVKDALVSSLSSDFNPSHTSKVSLWFSFEFFVFKVIAIKKRIFPFSVVLLFVSALVNSLLADEAQKPATSTKAKIGVQEVMLPSTRSSGGSPIWVHFIHFDNATQKPIGGGPAKALEIHGSLRSASPFLIYTPIPSEKGWAGDAAILESVSKAQALMREHQCDSQRLVVSGEGSGVTAAFLFAAAFEGRVGAILCFGAPASESFASASSFRYAPIRMLLPTTDQASSDLMQKAAISLRGLGCAVTMTDFFPRPELAGGVWAMPELWAWMVTRQVATRDARDDMDSILMWAKPNLVTSRVNSLQPVTLNESKLVKGVLMGEYFEDTTFAKSIVQREDKQIQFLTKDLYQLPNNRVENLSVRWTGYIRIVKAGTYTFYSRSTDGQKLWIGDAVMIDDWKDHGDIERERDIDLSVGWYAITVEHYHGQGDGIMAVSWQGPGFNKKPLNGVEIGALKANQ